MPYDAPPKFQPGRTGGPLTAAGPAEEATPATEPESTAPPAPPEVTPPPAPDPGRIGGFAEGSELRVPRGCVAVVVPIHPGNLKRGHHVSQHVEANALTVAQRNGLKGAVDGLKHCHAALGSQQYVDRSPAAVRWMLEQIAGAAGLLQDFRATPTSS